MARTNSIAQNKVDPTRPFYAAIGSVDAAVAFARDFEPKAVPGRVEELVSDYVSELSETVSGTVDDLNKQYVDLAARGRTLVNRIRRQESTRAARAQASSTVSRAKTTTTQAKHTADTAKDSGTRSAKETVSTAKNSARTTANRTKNAAGTTKSSAKATGTTAKKTASATKKATQDAAAKTGR
jgi:heparin binding hemagglutinin HbhA